MSLYINDIKAVWSPDQAKVLMTSLREVEEMRRRGLRSRSAVKKSGGEDGELTLRKIAI